MSSFVMSKSEVVVLFDLLGTQSTPVGIKDLPEVDEFEYERIVNAFSVNQLINMDGEHIKPDKGLAEFLLPIMTPKTVLIFNYGRGQTCTFNASLYFASVGLAVILDNDDGTVKFLRLASFDDLLLFIPNVSCIVGLDTESKFHTSYLLIENGYSIVHYAKIDHEKQLAHIAEGKRTPDSSPVEAEYEVKIAEYVDMLNEKLKEVYDAVDS